MSLLDLPPPDLDPVQMLLGANLIVQAVIGILLLASIASWTILLAKALELRATRRQVAAALRAAATAAALDDLAATLGGTLALLEATLSERAMSEGLPADGVRDRAALRLARIEAATARRLARGLGILASIGACAPFIGLFGTVWGIMNAFIGISRAQTTTLAVVAPGIAEALLATAAGLVAAIPAVLIYNGFSRVIAARRAELGDLSAAILVLLSRDLDRARPLMQPALARPVLELPVPLRDAAE